MRHSRLITLFIALIAATSLHAQSQIPGNLLANPGFEDTHEGFPAGWSTFDAKARSLVAIDAREVFAGRYSLRVTGDPGENWAPLFSGTVKTEPGSEYTLGCYAKTQLKPATGSITFALREISDAGQSIRFDHVQIPHQSE
ncbi:MAG: carbohydrate binding domain-containing protein, partial [Bacteroidota bacterium]